MLLTRLLGHGLGLALLPELTAAEYLQAGDLVAIPLPSALPKVRLLARWSPDCGETSPALRALLATARRYAPRSDELAAQQNRPAS
jgi:DNA-binding transcriptional LysR family regulator